MSMSLQITLHIHYILCIFLVCYGSLVNIVGVPSDRMMLASSMAELSRIHSMIIIRHDWNLLNNSV